MHLIIKPPNSPRSLGNRLETFIAQVSALPSLLVFPLVLLLFAQWPLRDLVQMYSRQANDLAQILFAIYVAVAVTAASHAGVHLSSSLPGKATVQRRNWRAWALAACTAPWAAFMLWAGWPVMVQSALSLEHFSETQSPGYFVIKLAMILMVLMVLFDSLLRLIPHKRQGTRP